MHQHFKERRFDQRLAAFHRVLVSIYHRVNEKKKKKKKDPVSKELWNEVFVRKNHNALLSGSKAARILFQKWLSRYRKKRWYIHSNGVIAARPVCCDAWTIAKPFKLAALAALVSKDVSALSLYRILPRAC